VAAFALHMFLAPFFFHHADLADWWFYGFIEYHVGVSPLIYGLVYGPGTFYVISYLYPLFLLASKNLFLPFLLKVPAILLVIVGGWYLWRSTGSTSRTALWLFSPLTILSVTVIGTVFDFIPTVLLFLSWIAVLKGQYRSSGILLAIAGGFKYYVLLAAPFFFIYVLKKERHRQSAVARNAVFSFFATFASVFILLHLPYLQVYAGHPFVYWFLTRTVPFYQSGFSGYRGADLNFLEYLKFDAGVKLPSFYLLFLPIYASLVLLAAYRMTPNRTSFARFLLLTFAGFCVTNPQLHLGYLLAAVPFILVFRKAVRDFIIYSSLVLISYVASHAGDLPWFMFPEFRSALGITLWSWSNPIPFYWVTYAGITLACVYLVFLHPDEINPSLNLTRSARPMESKSARKFGRSQFLAVICAVVIFVSVVSIIYATPNVQFVEMNRYLSDNMLHLRTLQFSNLQVIGQRNLTRIVPEYVYSGPLSNHVHLSLELNGTLTNYLVVRVDNRMLWEYNSSYPTDNMTASIPDNWLSSPNLVITITSPSWFLKSGLFRIDLDVSHMTPYFERLGATLYLPQALSLVALLTYFALRRKRKLGV
jgi:hypothetical protein